MSLKGTTKILSFSAIHFLNTFTLFKHRSEDLRHHCPLSSARTLFKQRSQVEVMCHHCPLSSALKLLKHRKRSAPSVPTAQCTHNRTLFKHRSGVFLSIVAVVRFSKQQSVYQRMNVCITVCDIAATKVIEIRLHI